GQDPRRRRGYGAVRARGPRGSRALSPEHRAGLRHRGERRAPGDRPGAASGRILDERLRASERLPEPEVQRIARDVANGLAHAHAHGLVHRDLKPGNILFDDEGRAKIADFGVARLENADTLTEEGAIVGTAAYLAPEQARGLRATPASD